MTGYRGTMQARLVAKLQIPSDHGCWLYTGKSLVAGGYGFIGTGGAGGSQILVHRAAYELFVGPIPEGMVIDHECHNVAVRNGECEGGVECQHRKCCNPWHLSAKSQAHNLNGGLHDYTTGETCRNGHPNAEFRHRSPKGQTYCRKCRADVKARARAQDKLREQRKRIEREARK
jgi:hypothetical protein